MPRNKPIVVICSEQMRLSDVVVRAVQANYAAKDAYDKAAKNESNIDTHAANLTRARKAESAAVAALDKHKREHDC